MYQLLMVNTRSTDMFPIMMHFPIIGKWYIIVFKVRIKDKNTDCQNKDQL